MKMEEREFNPFYPGNTIFSSDGIPPAIRLSFPNVKESPKIITSQEATKELEQILTNKCLKRSACGLIMETPLSCVPTEATTSASSNISESIDNTSTSENKPEYLSNEIIETPKSFRLPFVNSAVDLGIYQSFSECSKLTLESLDDSPSLVNIDPFSSTLDLNSVDDTDIITWYKQHIRCRLAILYKQKRLCDMILHCNEKTIHVHSLVACITNNWFTRYKDATERSENLNDCIQSNNLKVFIHDIDPTLLDVLIDYMYTGRFRTLKQMSLSKLRAINDAAFKLGISEINLFGSEFTKDIISTKNFVQLWDFADHINNCSLRTNIVNFIINRFESLWMSIELLTLSEERLKRILSSVSTKPHLQDVALRALLAWVKQDITLRRSSFPVLVTYIKINNVSESYLRFLLHHDPYVQENERLRKMLERSLKEKVANNPDELHSTYQIKYKKVSLPATALKNNKRKWLSRSASTVRMGHGSCSPLARRVLSPSTMSPSEGTIALSIVKTQSPEKNFPIKKKSTLSVSSHDENARIAISEKVPYLVILGKDMLNCELILMFYAVDSDSWMEIDSVGPWTEQNQGIACWKNQFYFVGGEDDFGKEKVRSVYVYDMHKKISHRLPDIHIPRSNPIIFFYEHFIFVAGGVGRYTDSLTQVESLDLSDENSNWKNAPPMRIKRGFRASACLLDDCVYIVGGGSARCECFHIKTRTWNELPSLPDDFNHSIPMVVVIDRRIMTFNYYRPNKMYFLDDDAQMWRSEVLKGNPPEWIISVTCYGKTAYVLEKSQKLYSLDIYKRRWNQGVKILRNQFQPLHISVCPELDIK